MHKGLGFQKTSRQGVLRGRAEMTVPEPSLFKPWVAPAGIRARPRCSDAFLRVAHEALGLRMRQAVQGGKRRAEILELGRLPCQLLGADRSARMPCEASLKVR